MNEPDITVYRVWAKVPDGGGGGWSCIARHLTRQEADVYERTLVFPTSVEED